MAPSNAITVGPDPLKLLGLLALGVVGVTAGVAGVLLGLSVALFGLNWLLSTGRIIVAATAVLAISCSGALFLAAIVGHRPRIEIGTDGFVVRTMFWSRSRRWSDIDGSFVVIKTGSSKGVGYRLTRAFKESAGIKPTTLFAGNDEGISGAYGVSIGELAELLNQYKGRARDGK